LTESLGDVNIGMLRPRTVLGVSGFLFAWVNQYRCHKYLFGLKKYTLPNKGMFRYFVTAHYSCECLLYLSLAFFAAPQGQMWNTTLLGNLLFVAVNLGCTASGTRKWYIEKFGKESVAGKWTMVPFLY
jgi:3-oxo-5-alpha-steroid 4-dehydrogenase 3 / polyprenol reductase